MPISFEQPGMVSPQISGAYGMALQFSNDAPALANIVGRTAELNQQAMARADQMRLANAALGADTANRQADRYFHSQVANADREQSALNIGATLSQRADESLLHANTALIQQRQGAELAVWANGQEMTQADNLRLQRLQQGVSAVMADTSLAPDEKQALLTQLRTGIDPLKQRQEAQIAKQTEMRTQAMESELARGKKAEADMQDMEAKLKQDGYGVMHVLDPDTGRSHMLIQNPKSGEWYNPMLNRGAGMSKQSEEADATDKVYKAFAAQAAAEFPDDQTTLEGKTSASPATLKQRAEFIKSLREAWDEKHEPQKPFVPGDASTMSKKQIRQVTEWSKLLDDVRSRPDAIMPPAAKQQAEAAIHALHAELAQYGSFQDPAKPIKKADEQIIMQSRGIVNSIPPRPQSAPLQGLREENKPATSFETNLQQLQSRQDLPPEVKSPLIRDIAAARTMINEAGGFDKLSAEKKRFVIDAARAFEELPKPGSGEAGQVSGAAMRSALELNLRRPQAGGIGDYLKRMASQTD